MRLETQVVNTTDGIDLFVRSYSPESFEHERTLYWIHGLGEHGGRHDHVAREMTQAGWRLVIADLRGHGRSTGIPTFVNTFDDYISDTAQIWQKLQLDNNSTALLGHSMGGLVAIRAVQSGSVNPSMLVISAPLLGLTVHVNPLTVLLGRLLVRFKPATRFSNGIDPGNMTHDPEFAALRRADPLIEKTVTAGWYFAMRSALEAAKREAARIELPILAIQGSLDRTTDPDALNEWWSRIQSADKKLVTLDGHFHELFFEPDWQATTDLMIEWLDERIRIADSKERS
jgi:alpha-beta hydrolase superfamily lysophospholipase